MVCRCTLITQQWLDSLRGSGSCSLLRGLEKAMALTDIDTLLIVMGSRYKKCTREEWSPWHSVCTCRPDEDKGTVTSYVRDRLTGLQLHWVAHQCDKETMVNRTKWCIVYLDIVNLQAMLFQLASETGAQFHSYSKSDSPDHQPQVEDTDIDTVTTQLKQWIKG